MSPKGVVALALLATWLASEGDIQLARAMRSLEGSGIGAMLLHPPLALAVGLLASHFLLWLRVLARLEVSVAMPLSACYYLFNNLLVQFRLGEPVSARCWLGTGLIVVGVILVTRSAGGPRGRCA